MNNDNAGGRKRAGRERGSSVNKYVEKLYISRFEVVHSEEKNKERDGWGGKKKERLSAKRKEEDMGVLSPDTSMNVSEWVRIGIN